MKETDIELSLGLDVNDAEKTAKQLQKEIQSIFSSRNGSSPALKSLQNQMRQTRDKIREVREDLEYLNNLKIDIDLFDSLGREFTELHKKEEELLKLFDEASSKGLQEVEYDGQIMSIQELEDEIDNLSDKMDHIRAQRNEIAQNTPEVQDFTSEEIDNQILEQKTKLDGLNDKLKTLISRYRETAAAARAAFAHKVVTAFQTAVNRLVGTVKKFFASLKKGANSSNKSFKKSLMTLLKYGLGIRSLYALFNKLRKAVKEGFTNMYNSSDKFKASVDSLKGSLTTFKNSIASAFQPIVSMAIPYIQRLVDWLTQLMDQLARFMAAAVGQKYYMKAIKQTGQAAEKASKQLSGLDKLNVINSDSGDGKANMFEEVPIDEGKIDLLEKLREAVAAMEGVGYKLGTVLRDALGTIPWDKIQTVVNLIAQGMGNFINGLVTVEGLGSRIGQTFANLGNTIIGFEQTLFDTLNFEKIGAFLGEGLQGFIDDFNWDGLGKLTATKINSLFATIKGFTDEFEGLSLGTSLGDSINSFLENLDWNTIQHALHQLALDIVGAFNGFMQTVNWREVGETLSTGIATLLDFVVDLVTNLDAESLGKAIIDFISGIDWLRLAAELGLLLLGLIEKAVELLFGLVGKVSENLADLFDELGWNGVAGFFRGISENLSTSVQWLKDTFNKYIVQPVKDFFGIHSPSKLFEDFGDMIIEGLKQGIMEKVVTVGIAFNLLKTKVIESFNQIRLAVKSAMDSIWQVVKKPINSILGGFEMMVNGIITALNKMIGALNTLDFDVPDWVPVVGGKNIGFNIPEIKRVSIPRLAQGAVLPPNREFMAVLGDQKSGTNVEAPLDTIKQALLEVLTATQGTGSQEIVLNLDGREFLRAMVKQNNEYKKQHNGASALT